MKIAIDFDGTCVAYAFPNIGQDIGAVPVLKELVAADHQLILWTVRGSVSWKTTYPHALDDAVNWFKQNDIPLYGINKNPGQSEWTNSPKAHADLYIDDSVLFAPTIFNPEISKKPYLNWAKVRDELVLRSIIADPIEHPTDNRAIVRLWQRQEKAFEAQFAHNKTFPDYADVHCARIAHLTLVTLRAVGNISPLFLFCKAVECGDDDVAASVQKEARRQYVIASHVYDKLINNKTTIEKLLHDRA